MNRTELIQHVISTPRETDKFITKSARGNSLWTVWERQDSSLYLVHHLLEDSLAGWHTPVVQTESTPPDNYTCPKKYLDMCAPVSVEWRQKTLRLPLLKQERKDKIKNLFKQGYTVRVTLQAPEGYTLVQYVFDIAEAHTKRPLGRSVINGLLYTLPLDWIDKIETIGEPHVKKKRSSRKKTRRSNH